MNVNRACRMRNGGGWINLESIYIVFVKPEEILQLGDIAGGWNFLQSLDLLICRLEANGGDPVSEVLNKGQHEGALSTFETSTCVSQSMQDFVERQWDP